MIHSEYQLWCRNGIYYFRLPGESSFHSTRQRNKRKAEQVINKIIREGQATRIKLSEYAKDFYVSERCQWIQWQCAKQRPFSQAMAKMRRAHLTNYLLPEFGDTTLDQINPVAFENWLATLPLSNQTKNHILDSLNIILREAKRERLVKVNPLEDVERMANVYRKRDVFAVAELQKLFPREESELLRV